MGCLFGGRGDGGAVKVVMEFHREELLYDIRNAAYIEARVISRGEEVEGQKAPGVGTVSDLVADIAEEGNIDRVDRMLDLLHKEITELLYAYTKRSVTRDVVTDKAERERVYVIMMEVPAEFSQTTLDYLKSLIHEWMVARVVTDWMWSHWPDKAKVWEMRADKTDDDIRGCVNTNASNSRIRLHPF